MTKGPERVLDRLVLHLGDGVRRVVDPADVYYLEVRGEDTQVRFRSASPLVDMRPMRELLTRFAPHGFLQIHREYAVNLRRIRQIRRPAQRPGNGRAQRPSPTPEDIRLHDDFDNLGSLQAL